MEINELRSPWECVSEIGHFFEFEHADHPKITIKVIAHDEEAAYQELDKILI